MSNWEIKTETINDDYYWGEFGGFRVIVREEDGYINGTNLVKGAGKRFPHWTDNKQTKELIREVASSSGIPDDDLMDRVTGGRLTDLRGTYVHPDLVIHLAQWCSPAYAVKVAHIVQDYHAREHRERARAEKKERKRLERKVERKRGTISRLEARIEEMIARQEAEAKKARRRADHRSARTDQKIGLLHDDLTDVKTELHGVSRKLDLAKHDRVVPTADPKHENRFALVKLNQDPSLFGDDEIPYDYVPIRSTTESLPACLARKRRQFPNCEVILELTGTPSAMALWRLYQEKHGHRIDRSRFYFFLRRGYTEAQLLDDLRAVHESRMTDEGLE